MLSIGEDDLICDFAETYQILNWESLDLALASTLAAGLPDSSRIKRKISGHKLTLEQMLMAHIADAARILAWQNTKDGHKGLNKPKSLLNNLLASGKKKKIKNDLMSFSSPEEYEKWRRKKQEEWSKQNV